MMIGHVRFFVLGLSATVVSATACSAPTGTVPAEHAYGQLSQASSGTLSWKGYEWNVTNGGMAGIANGDPNNVSVDASGYLHLKITKSGTTWTAAELFSATNLGFGTYQWQVSGPVDRMDHTIVLGLSPYGPAAGVGSDGFNEIDTEFSYWNDEIGHVNMDWGVYPADSKAKHYEDDFFFSLNGGTETTTRMVWSSTSIASTVMAGYQPIGGTANVLAQNTYAPPNASDAIPQQPLPVLLNLWIYEAAPSSGNGLEIVLQDFQFVPEGDPLPDAGTASGPDDAAADDDTGSSQPTPPTHGDAGGVDSGAETSSDAGGGSKGTDAGHVVMSEDAGTPAAGDDAGTQGSAGNGGSGGCSVQGAAIPIAVDPRSAYLAVLFAVGLVVRRGRSKCTLSSDRA